MKKSGWSLTLASVTLLTGCMHKPAPVQPVVAAAPPEPAMVVVSVPPPTHPTEPLPPRPEATASSLPDIAPEPSPQRKARRKPRPATATASTTASAASAGAAPAAPATAPDVASARTPDVLGKLSADSTSSVTEPADSLITAQEKRLAVMPANVLADHKTQMEQAHRFLEDAKKAWGAGDKTGAYTLATKAKVLLDEVQQ